LLGFLWNLETLILFEGNPDLQGAGVRGKRAIDEKEMGFKIEKAEVRDAEEIGAV
jgi:hypothetical protein